MITYSYTNESFTQVTKEVKQSRFPDGTLHLEPLEIPVRYNYYTITWCYDSDEEMFTLACVVDIFRRNNAGAVNLILPYVPNARMDRIHKSTENFSLKVFTNFINSLNFDKVTVVNVHSTVSEAIINNINSVLPEKDWKKVVEEYQPEVIVFPDEGACKRYSSSEAFNNYPIAYGIKKRDWETGKILGLTIHGASVYGKKCLIVDDLCSGGGTFYYTGNELKKQGATEVRLYITHCENTVKTGKLFEEDSPVSKIYTTDTILTDKEVIDKVEIVNRWRRSS